MQKSLLRLFGLAFLAATLLAVVCLVQNRSTIRSLENKLRQRDAAIAALSETNAPGSSSRARLYGRHTTETGFPGATPPVSSTNKSGASKPHILARIQSETQKLTISQVETYLKTAGRTAPTLLAAYRSSGDAGLLREAMEKFPADPKVAFEGAIRPGATPEERAQLLKGLKELNPENALGYYLSAADAFKDGKTQQGLKELAAAATKTQFNDFTLERIQSDEDLYLASGYTLAEAKTIPGSHLLLPQLGQLRELGKSLTELVASYRSAGDDASADNTLTMVLQLAGRYVNRNTGDPEISRPVGMAIESDALKMMPPASAYGDAGQTVQERLTQIDTERQEIKDLYASAKDLLPKMSEQEWVSFVDHRRLFGEPAALRWLISNKTQ